MAVERDPTTWDIEKGGEPIEMGPPSYAESVPIEQPVNRSGVITIRIASRKMIRTFNQYAIPDYRYHGDARDKLDRYREFKKSDTIAKRADTHVRERYKLPRRSYIPKTVVLGDMPVLNLFNFDRTYLAQAQDDKLPTPDLTIEEGIPESWERPARLARLHKLETERFAHRKQVSRGLDKMIPYRDHVIDLKSHKKRVAQHGAVGKRAAMLNELLKQGARYTGQYDVERRAPVMPVAVPVKP